MGCDVCHDPFSVWYGAGHTGQWRWGYRLKRISDTMRSGSMPRRGSALLQSAHQHLVPPVVDWQSIISKMRNGVHQGHVEHSHQACHCQVVTVWLLRGKCLVVAWQVVTASLQTPVCELLRVGASPLVWV